MSMLLAGDVGGTSTRIGLFDLLPVRPRAVVVNVFATRDFTDLSRIVAAFIKSPAVNGAAIDGACFGVAGPVTGDTAWLTNVRWRIEAREMATAFGWSRVRLLNDLQAMAYSVPVLTEAEVHPLQPGQAIRGGNMALIAAWTGLGEALLHNVKDQFIPSATEGGHADYAPRNDREVELMRDLTSRYGRAEVEHVISGRGLLNVHRVTHKGPCDAKIDLNDSAHAPAAISAAALDHHCLGCVAALELFVEAYGAEAGNLALRAMATGGLYIGGGIAPKILPALTTGAFMDAFRAKGQFDALLRTVPVKVILNAEAGLLGAAVFGAGG